MTIEEKRNMLNEFCTQHDGCERCIIDVQYPEHDCGRFGLFKNMKHGGEYRISDDEVVECYSIVMNNGDFPYAEEETESKVDHPGYYNAGKIEAIDFIEDQQLNFSRGSALKYLVRAGKKNPDTEIEDLEKAAWYINREIERIRGEKGE